MSPIAKAIAAAGGPARVASLLGCSVQAICFYWDEKRSFPVEHGAVLERASGVMRWHLWPEDWHRIWPELIGAEGAPAVPAAAETRDAA